MDTRMENAVAQKLSFSSSYEIKKFDEVTAELLVLDRIFSAEQGPNIQSYLPTVWNVLVQLIAKQKLEAESTLSGPDLKIFNEVLFVSVALIDEFFMRKEKMIYDFWKKHLLEFRFFQSRNAGNLFYTNIDDILQKNDVNKKNLAFIYFQALGMGFKGRYFESANANDILKYRRSLYSFLFNKNLFVIDDSNNPSLKNGLFILEETKGVNLAKTVKLYTFIVLIVITYIISTYVVWYYQRIPLESFLRRVSAPVESVIR